MHPRTGRSKGGGNKIDPNKGSVLTATVAPPADAFAGLSDELLLRILRCLEPIPYPCSLVCKRWLYIHGRLCTSIRVHEWSFLTSGHLASRFPNLTHVDLTGAWLTTSKQPSILFTHQFITIQLSTNAYDPSSIERFIEDRQISPSVLDKGLKALADGCPSLQRLCMIDVRRATYNRASFRNREPAKADEKTSQAAKFCQSDEAKNTASKMMQDNSMSVNRIGDDSADVKGSPKLLLQKQLKPSLPHDDGLAYLAKKCTTLQELVLNQCTDDSLHAIAECKNLQILRLVGTVSGYYHCTFTDIGLTILAKGCTRLVKLELSGCEASYDGIAAIGQCCFMLEELTLSNQGFYEGWIAALFYCSCLKTLRLESCKQIDPIPGPTEHLRQCAALQRLEFVRCNLRDKAGLSALLFICMKAKELSFQDCWGLDNETFRLTEICRHVRLLSLEGCSLLTTAGLEAVVLSWKDLHTLKVVYCNNIKDSEISSAMAVTFSTLKELRWRPDTKSILADNLAGTGVGQIGGKFFKHGGSA